ncbi:hypothetical protein ENSA5_18140 [Enhygromyxa salina]|uniref:Uncharacterized protein n=1 Tax=Enhygromyxa salina TaxID=215803 RepID=A0A2S9YD67_9BACT|nr:hypothetical protein [Enhygromyxa salina]PRQ03043.1 hypothetical protein ENSA5_18140 [Enhygromyxa salina]
MDEGAPHTHWIDGRLVDEHSASGRSRGESHWVVIIAVLVILIGVDLALGLAPDQITADDPNPNTSADMRANLRAAAEAAREGRPALVLVGDSVLAGDVMAGEVEDWRSQRVVDHMRAELSFDSDAEIQQIALDGLLPIDALHVLAELDRVDPKGEVQFVLELNLRYFSNKYREQDHCTREELCELGRTLLVGGSPEATDAGTLHRAAVGLVEATGLAQDWLVARTPIHRRRGRLRRLELDAVEGLAVRKHGPNTNTNTDTDTELSEDQRRAQGLARVQEHYRSSTLATEHAQVQALTELLDRLAARGRPATLFLTPLEDEFVRGTLPRNHLGRRHEQIARIVNDHAEARAQATALIDLDHPLFESNYFLDHVHLGPEGNRLLAINLLHELGLPLASRPFDWMMVHGEDHDRTLVHRRGTGYADGGPWEALLRKPRGVAVSRDGSWVVIADTGNHVLRQMRGNMQFLERLAGKPMKAGVQDGEALERARLTEPHSPQIVGRGGAGERVYFIDGKTSNRVRELADGFVRTLVWLGPACPRYDVLEAGVLDERERLYLLCHDDRILTVDLESRRSTLTLDPRAPMLAEPETGAAREYTTIEPTDDGRLLFADGDSQIWSMVLRANGRARAPERIFANDGADLIPSERKSYYPFGFDEMRFEQIVDMEWVERYGGLLIQDQHELSWGNKRLHREETERIHLRLIDFETEQILPWVKAIPHAEAFHMWNAKTSNFVSYFHLGAMAIAQDDAALVWVERERSRVFRLADGLLGVHKYGNLHTDHGIVQLLQPIGTQTSWYVGANMRPDRFMATRHEPIPRRGPYVALLVGSSLSTISDRLGNYSLGRRLELELQAELGYRDNIRLDLFQRSASSSAFYYSAGMFEQFLDANGPPPDILFFELHDFGGRFFRGTETHAERVAELGKLERLAARYGTLVIFYDNSAIEANGHDGLRRTHRELREFIADARKLGFVVLEPSDRLLRELMTESPWGNQTWTGGEHHGAPWAIDLTARALASMSYPLIREFLRGREPARLSERDPTSFDEGDDSERLSLAFEATEGLVNRQALPEVDGAYLQRAYGDRQVRIHVDLGGYEALGRTKQELEELVVAVLYAVLVDEVYGELATDASVELVEFSNYDEYGEGVLESANSVWSRSFERASLERFIRDHRARKRGRGEGEAAGE